MACNHTRDVTCPQCRGGSITVSSGDYNHGDALVEIARQRGEIARLESELRDYKRLVQALRDGKVSTDDLQPDVEILHPDWQAELLQRFKQEA